MSTEKNTLLNSIFEKLSIIEKKQEVVEEPVQEVELSEEVKEEVVEEVKEEVELSETPEAIEQPAYVTKEMFDAKMTELSEMFKESLSKLESEKTELSEQVVELSKEPAAKAIVHSPESEGVENGTKFQFGSQRPQGTRNRVMDRISNFK